MTAKLNARARLCASLVAPAMMGVAIVLAACVDDHTAALISNPATHHPIGFGAAPEALIVEVPPGGADLSRNQQADVFRFVERYKQESSGSLRIEAPRAAGGHLAASRSLRQIETIVADAGLDPNVVEIRRQGGKAAHAGALTLSYDRTVAVPPECGDWSDDLGKNRERLPYNNFGCATQRNLALTVANGRDLQVPQEETPRSSERRSASWSEYIKAGSGGGASPVMDAPAPTTTGR
jgi:pilus assembly protein CpaD